MYLILGLSGLNAVFFTALVIIGKSRLQSVSYGILPEQNEHQSNVDDIFNRRSEEHDQKFRDSLYTTY